MFVWITLVNRGYVHYTKNFMETMKRANVSFKLHVCCIDAETLEALQNIPNIVCIGPGKFPSQSLTSEMTVWGNTEYKKICFAKLDVMLYAFTTLGAQTVAYIDTDVVLFADPTSVILKAMSEHPDVSVFGQCDEAAGMCSNPNCCPNICAGIIVFRKTVLTEFPSLFKYDPADVTKYSADQEFLNEKFMRDSIRTYIIPKDVFLNGTYPGVKAGCTLFPPSACLVHFNYMIGEEKQRCMKAHNLWLIS